MREAFQLLLLAWTAWVFLENTSEAQVSPFLVKNISFIDKRPELKASLSELDARIAREEISPALRADSTRSFASNIQINQLKKIREILLSQPVVIPSDLKLVAKNPEYARIALDRALGTYYVHGNDGMIDWKDATPQQQDLSDSVCLIVSSAAVRAEGNKFYLKTVPYTWHDRTADDTVKFGKERVVSALFAPATGFLVADPNTQALNRIVTATHVLGDPNRKHQVPDEKVYIFGYYSSSPTNSSGEVILEQNQVYEAKKDILWSSDDWNTGVSVVQLNRVVGFRNAKGLTLNREDNLAVNENVGLLGYFAGHPLKPDIEPESVIMKVDVDGTLFSTNVDGFSGNSGSPIINVKNNIVIGVFVQGLGIDDYEAIPRGKFKNLVVDAATGGQMAFKSSLIYK